MNPDKATIKIYFLLHREHHHRHHHHLDSQDPHLPLLVHEKRFCHCQLQMSAVVPQNKIFLMTSTGTSAQTAGTQLT